MTTIKQLKAELSKLTGCTINSAEDAKHYLYIHHHDNDELFNLNYQLKSSWVKLVIFVHSNSLQIDFREFELLTVNKYSATFIHLYSCKLIEVLCKCIYPAIKLSNLDFPDRDKNRAFYVWRDQLESLIFTLDFTFQGEYKRYVQQSISRQLNELNIRYIEAEQFYSTSELEVTSRAIKASSTLFYVLCINEAYRVIRSAISAIFWREYRILKTIGYEVENDRFIKWMLGILNCSHFLSQKDYITSNCRIHFDFISKSLRSIDRLLNNSIVDIEALNSFEPPNDWVEYRLMNSGEFLIIRQILANRNSARIVDLYSVGFYNPNNQSYDLIANWITLESALNDFQFQLTYHNLL